MRQIDYILEGVRYLNDVGADKEDGDVSDEDIDAQFADTILDGMESGTPYNIKTIRSNRPV